LPTPTSWLAIASELPIVDCHLIKSRDDRRR
jgi:hypothetical protein